MSFAWRTVNIISIAAGLMILMKRKQGVLPDCKADGHYLLLDYYVVFIIFFKKVER